jgi:hypothetical protein
MGDGNKPEQKFRAGSVTATVWKNVGNRNGRDTEFFTVALQRSYKKGDEWQNTNSLRVRDISDAQLVLGKAHEYLRLKNVEQQNGASDAGEDAFGD